MPPSESSYSGARTFGRHVAVALVTLVVVVSLNFVVFRALPGDAVSNLARVPGASPQLRQSLEERFGLDQSLGEQYVAYLVRLAQGDLGVSFTDQSPVIASVGQALRNTVPMVAAGTIVAMVLGVASGLLSVWWRGSPIDHGVVGAALALYALPAQWIGLMLILALGGVFPAAGMRDDFLVEPGLWQQLVDEAWHMVLPSITLGLALFGGYTLIVRSALIETLGDDYVLAARGLGLTSWQVMRYHVFPNAALPIVTLISLSLGYVVAGAILVETVFSWPGIGRAIYDAVLERDYPMLQGAFLVLAVSVIAFNLAADLLYSRLDPRVRA